ncbi:outer membrane biogenesis protein BamB [Planctomycetes bacterium CA13]|uniref:Outer membrane biogenesis protein BamB n=1 Tax=Novipirellula herctigrandis TaxID=2527986 RepID=A0A5C5ZE32_9BACT|nr:outer membrane biogenesis protein BamB [Planctomycetes bacterium CA13]
MRKHAKCTVVIAGVLFFGGCGADAQEERAASLKTTTNTEADVHQSPAGDWRQFRGPNGMAGSQGSTESLAQVPAQWNQGNIRWQTPLPGAGASSPIIVRDRVYVTCYSGYGVPGAERGNLAQLKLMLVCVNRKSGDILWTKSVQPSLPEQETIRDEHGYSSSTPVADDKNVYVFFGKTGVFAFEQSGEQKWHSNVGSRLNGWGTAASPVIHEDLLIVNASVESDSVVALNRKTGEEVWRTEGIREAWNTPLLVKNPMGKTELIVPIFQKVLSLDPATGEQNWTCDTDIQWYMVPSPVAHEGVVYCIGGRSGDSLAIRTGGSGDVTATHRLWKTNKGSNVSSPIFYDGHLYWVHDQRGIAYCANANTGAMVYEERLPRVGQVYASPVLADGKIFFVARDGRVVVLAAEPEFTLLATNELEERGRFDASPAASGNQLFLRSNRFLYCIGADK